MGTEKKFYRVRLSEKCAAASKIVNGVMLTKQWLVKAGEAGDFAKFPDVEAQAVVKQGNGFVPAGDASGEARGKADDSSGGSGSAAQPGGGQAAPASNPAESAEAPDFNGWTVEQLKTWLIAKGAAQNELRNSTKTELVERAELLWPQK